MKRFEESGVQLPEQILLVSASISGEVINTLRAVFKQEECGGPGYKRVFNNEQSPSSSRGAT